MITTKHVNNALVYYDDRYDNRWIDALGENVRKYLPTAGPPRDDTTLNLTEWTVTEVDVGAGDTSVTSSVTAGNWALVTTAQNENDGISSMQLNGETFEFAVGRPCYFGIRCAASDATQSDLLVGLAEIDTTLLAAHAINVAGDGAFFSKLDAVTTINANAYNGGASTAQVAVSTALDTGYHTYEIYFDGVATIYYYFDGTLVTSASSSGITAAFTPSIGFLAGEAAAKTLEISWVRCIQVR